MATFADIDVADTDDHFAAMGSDRVKSLFEIGFHRISIGWSNDHRSRDPSHLDYNAFFIDSDFAFMTRHIEALLAGDPRNPLIGRELPHLMRRAKLKIDAIEQTTLAAKVAGARRLYAAALSRGTEAGLFSAADVEAWWREQEEMERNGTFYHAHPGYIVAATNP